MLLWSLEVLSSDQILAAATAEVDDVSIPFRHFVAHSKSQTCSSDSHARPFNNQIRGVNLGGWMVLEPWVTPSLFYQFLNGDETNTAMDIYTFCEVLGPEEGNRQLRHHWDNWVTEDIIQQLSHSMGVNSLRLPIGDFMYKPYGPYVGCTDGALDYVDQLLDWAYSYGLDVLIDIHAMKDSQNGFDNSGQAMGLEWTSKLNIEPAGLVTFEHWGIRTAKWVGTFDSHNINYTSINYDNLNHSLEVITEIARSYGGHPAVLGLQPVNEPWEKTPIDVLKKFYWDGYLIVKRHAPYWKYIMHDSFRFTTDIWGGFMDGCPDRALDTHIYQAWKDPASRIQFYQDACQRKKDIAAMEREFGPVIVGEWSLATDNCAMWLNGFNDNLPGFPRSPCKYISCDTKEPYLGGAKNNFTELDPNKPIQGPYGTGMSGPLFGLCPTTRDWLVESSGNPQTGRDWIRAPPEAASKDMDDTDRVMKNLARKKINAFSGIGHGFYFWNFRTDLYDPAWSYMDAMDRKWIPLHGASFKYDPKITDACQKEDAGEFQCVVKRHDHPKESNIQQGILFCLESELLLSVSSAAKEEGDTTTTATKSNITAYVNGLTGKALLNEGDKVFNKYWQAHRVEGTTCDFGGVAMLIEEENATTTSGTNNVIPTSPKTDHYDYNDDDEYHPQTIVYQGPNVYVIVGVILCTSILGGLLGFILAMHFSRKFNRQVRKSFFSPANYISEKKSNRNLPGVLRNSLALDKWDFEDDNLEPDERMSLIST